MLLTSSLDPDVNLYIKIDLPKSQDAIKGTLLGVTFVYNKCDFRERKLPGKKFEIVVGVDKIPRYKRKIIVLPV